MILFILILISCMIWLIIELNLSDFIYQYDLIKYGIYEDVAPHIVTKNINENIHVKFSNIALIYLLDMTF